MDGWIPGGLFTVLFLWGLWEWSKRAKKGKTKDNSSKKIVKKLDAVDGIDKAVRRRPVTTAKTREKRLKHIIEHLDEVARKKRETL